MEIEITTLVWTIINISLLIAIIILLYKMIKGIRNFINRNKMLDKKVDIILSKLDREDNE